MSYILTQTHPNHGIQGLVVDREGYLACAYYDRALFEVLNEDTEQYYYCRVDVFNGDKKAYYLILDSDNIGHTLHEFGLYKYAWFVTKELAKGHRASLQVGDDQIIVFSLIKSN